MTDPTDRPAPLPSWWRRAGQALARFWRRVVAYLSGPEPSPPQPALPPGRLTERRSITPVAVPARGFAFDFELHGVFEWTSDGLERPALRSLIETFLPYAREHLKGVAAGLARGVEPHRGEDLERRLRQRLRERGDWIYERNGQRVACRAHVRVQPDKRVLDSIRPYWERLMALDYERDVAARRARHAHGVSSQWAMILKKLLDGPEPGGAARMTDEQLAAVVREILAEKSSAEEALTGVDPQAEYQREGFFDLLSERGRRRPAA